MTVLGCMSLLLVIIIFNNNWLFKLLTRGTEDLLIAVQDQVLSTRAMWHAYSAANLSLCHLCGGYDETVEHLVSGYSFLAVSQYIMRHT